MNGPCTLVIIKIVLASMIPINCLADRVYRCYQNGTPTFTEIATDQSCQGMEITPHQPDPDTVARQTNELKHWQEQHTSILGSKTRNKRNAPEAHGTAGSPLNRDRPESRNAGDQNPELPGALQFQAQDTPQ